MSLVIGTASVTCESSGGCGGVEPHENVPDVRAPGGTGAAGPGSGLRRAAQRGLCFVRFFSDRSHVSRKGTGGRLRWAPPEVMEQGRMSI